MIIPTPPKHIPLRRYLFFGWLLCIRDIQKRYFLILHNRNTKDIKEVKLNQVKNITVLSSKNIKYVGVSVNENLNW